ncbi:hypothetical protein JHK82_032444 [Glycine max]|uniref:Uncharacterized protein n=1 Tax=Glycine soja TaxID=3848 RepID=A0A0B2RKM8_GLYSO|nr:hypothetical protein JHK87_032384 [Glycine soja]KAG4979197.1 hypothetical protein JHK85_033155 [Glycine max]KAG4984850.1 hypothetical protein JHK86_032541 [Glycine max]KAG5118024.1 hypothetical protein JHK82_032444 [Glycine max]KAG5139012.1 hypothetical protein JHK84_032780 [Glycine max]
MVKCFDFFLSLNFGKMTKLLVWRTDKPQDDMPQTPNSRKWKNPFSAFIRFQSMLISCLFPRYKNY